MDDALLITKLHRPASPHVLIERPRLFQRLATNTAGKLTLVCAPAGFGKSSLISQWLGQPDPPKSAWLSLDDGDNDLRSFMTYFIAAFQQVDERIGGITSAMLQSPQLPTIETLVSPLVNDITATNEALILVLDDYHVIELQEIHDVLSFLLTHQPSNLHLIILSRHDPPLALGRLRAQGNVREFRSADLRFNQEESNVFFQSVMKTDLNLDEVAALQTRTEGWVAGLQLAGLALQRQQSIHEFVQRFAGSHEFIVDYLGDEVLNQQTDEIRNFLLKTSILERFNAALCDQVTGSNRSHHMLEYLSQVNLFLIPLDNENRWYRYHHLFSDFLKYQLRRNYPKQVSNLHLRASDWFHENGFIDDAIYHALAGEHYENAAELIEQVGLKMVGRARFDLLKNWLDALPQQLWDERPYLGILLAWSSVLKGKPGDAVAQLNMAEGSMQHVLEESNTWLEVACQLELLRGYVARSNGDLVTTISQTKKALEYLPENNPFLQCTVYLNLGGNYWLSGDLVAAEDPLYRATAFVNQAGTEYPALAAAGFLANVYLQTGRLRQARTHCQKTTDAAFSHRSHPLPAIAYIYVEQGELFYEQNDLAAAEEILENAIRLATDVDRVVNIARATQLIALIKHAKGEAEATSQHIDQANTLFEESGSRYNLMRQMEFDYYRVRLWLWQGNLIMASQWAQDHEAKHEVNTTWGILNELSLARVLLANRQPDKALPILSECQHLAQSSALIGWMIESLILKALCYQTLGKENDALLSLTQALSLAEPEGYVRSFADEGVAMGDLLTSLIARYADLAEPHPFSADYASQLNVIIRSESQEMPGLIEPLTDRELDILRLLASGLTNPEIADELVISVGTVKQHNHAIFRKLDVRTRKQAVERARELYLL